MNNIKICYLITARKHLKFKAINWQVMLVVAIKIQLKVIEHFSFNQLLFLYLL